MKKVLTLVLVLAVAQLATAAVWWDVSDAGGGQFNVSLNADENVKNVMIAQLVSDGTSFAVSPLNDAGIWNGGFTGASTSGFIDLSVNGAQGYGNAFGQLTTAGEFVTGTLASFTVNGSLGDTITVQDLTAFGVSEEIFTETSGSNALSFADFGAGSFELVPEPMTMALLGLGGLFVRRRRA